ncbi:MAG: hypothetical protein FJ038_01430 [Chloroflexi bacterium]|nr:hypothetical protein [Chloroflexota bacterium]
MPQISLPDIELSEIGERIQEAAEDARVPDEVRERLENAAELLADVGERITAARGRLGSEVGERLSEVRWPALVLPAALRALPGFRLPALAAPAMDVPRVDPGDLRRAVARLELPQVTIGKPPAGPPVVPLLILAAVGGAFVGWWLATSTTTSTRVRSAVRQVRLRAGLERADDLNMEAMGEDFWADDRDWASEAGEAAALVPGPDEAATELEQADDEWPGSPSVDEEDHSRATR